MNLGRTCEGLVGLLARFDFVQHGLQRELDIFFRNPQQQLGDMFDLLPF